MIFNLFRKPSVTPDAVLTSYRSIVAQSRQVKFYGEWGVEDSVTGRFDMVSLHLALYLRRLKNEPTAKDFTQALVEPCNHILDHLTAVFVRHQGCGIDIVGRGARNRRPFAQAGKRLFDGAAPWRIRRQTCKHRPPGV